MSDDDGRRRIRHHRDDKYKEGTSGFAPHGSGVNYSQISNRHVDDTRYEKHKSASDQTTSVAVTTASSTTAQPRVSAQMEAVMRLMSGMEERTIAQKLADSNRPTWEQYKKDNEDKLNISGPDQKKMEEYRKQLDQERDKILARGTNHGSSGKTSKDKTKSGKKSVKRKRRRHRNTDDATESADNDFSESDDRDENSSYEDKRNSKRKKHPKKNSSNSKGHKKKKKRRYRPDESDRSDCSSNFSSDENESSEDSQSFRKKNHRKKNKRTKKEKRTKVSLLEKKTGSDDSDSDNNGYRLSSFFNKGSGADGVND